MTIKPCSPQHTKKRIRPGCTCWVLWSYGVDPDAHHTCADGASRGLFAVHPELATSAGLPDVPELPFFFATPFVSLPVASGRSQAPSMVRCANF